MGPSAIDLLAGLMKAAVRVPDKRLQSQMILTLRSVDPEGRVSVPLLKKWSADPNPATREFSIALLCAHAALWDSNPKKEIKDEWTLFFVPFLDDSSSEVRFESAMALDALDASRLRGTKMLVELSRGDDPEMKKRAVDALGHSCVTDRSATEALLNFAEGNDRDLRIRALCGLAHAHFPRLVNPVVLRCLKDPDPVIRAKAALVSAYSGRNDPAAKSGLEATLKDPHKTVREAADEAMRTTCEQEKKDAAILDGLAHTSAEIRAQAARNLTNLPPTDATLQLFMTALRDPDAAVRSEAELFIGQLDFEPVRIVDELRNLAKDLSSEIQISALKAMSETVQWWTGRSEKPAEAISRAISTLLEFLDHPESSFRHEAAEALGDIGPDAGRALPALQTLLKDPDSEVRSTAEEAIERIIRQSE
jgi:HEAT repeat protein